MNQKARQKTKLTSLLLALCMVIAMVPSFTIDLTAFAAEAASTDPSDDWEYSLNADGTAATLTKYTGTAADVYIPSTVTDDAGERISVTALGEGVFKGNTGINSATFGDGITTIGASAFEGATNLVCIVSPETLTTIGNRAFFGCAVFNSVILYDAVTSIGADAFAGCPSVTVWVNEGSAAHTYAVSNSIPYEIINPDATPETYVQDGVTYYIMNGEAYITACDDTLTEVVIPSIIEGYPVVEIREAFREHKSLVNIILPESLKVIGKYSFYACTSLSHIEIPSNVQTIGEYAFSSCINMTDVYISDSVTNIGNYAFSSCSKLESINIPRKITVLSSGMFEKCRALETIIIPDNILEISGGAFSECNALKNIEIPANVTSVGQTAFYKCNSLTSVTIPTTLTHLGTQAFRACQNLKTVILENTNVSYRYAFEDCTNLKTAILPNGLSEISAGMFSRCKNLIDITIPNSVTQIGSSAFNVCESLTEIVIPENVTKIESLAFQGCKNLTSITFNYGLLSIGDNAFAVCNKLYEFNIPESVTTIGSNIFRGTNGMQTIKLSQNITSLQPDSFFINTVLLVKENSYAHTFATDNNLLYFIENNLSEPYFYNADGITYYIFNGNAIAVSSEKTLSKVSVPEKVEEYTVTELKRTFENCTELTSITLPKTITNIDDYSFANCGKLTQINIPDSVNRIGVDAFSYCSSLSEIAIPNNVAVIESGAFGNCVALKKAVIPESVTAIYANSFPKTAVWLVIENSYAHIYAIENEILYLLWDGNSEVALYEIDGVSYMIDSGNAIIYDYDTSLSTTELVIPNEVGGVPVTKILEKVFYFATKLQKITLPDSLKVIEDYAFSYCRGLTEINLPEGITDIGRGALDHTALKSIVIPDSVTNLGASVFFECQDLAFAVVGKNVPSLRGAFQYCYALEKVNIPEGVRSIDDYAFYNCRKLKHITIPRSVTSISIYAFAGSGIESIELNEGITFIAFNAFQNCTNLEEVFLPDSLLEMMHSSFEGCTNLKKVRLSNSLKEIPGGSFYECFNLENVIIPRSIESLSTNSFPSNTILCVYENSYAHNFAKDNNLLYFVLRETPNPEIAYGAGISGTVTLDGSPASGATVELLYDDGVVKETVTTDDTGAYSFTYAEVGAYTIRATSGSVSGTEKVSVKRMNAFDVFLTGETDIVLKNSWTVSGSVSPVSATVTLTDTDGNVIEKLNNITNGTYAFTNVPNGTYIVKAETENGSAVREVTVFNANVTLEDIVIASESAVIKGIVSAEARDGSLYAKNYATVILRDSNGTVTEQTKTEGDGSYSFNGVAPGKYFITAEAEEQRSDRFDAYQHPHKLSGSAYAEVSGAGEYTADITIREEGAGEKITVSGKVTAQGENQPCRVILSDVSGNEIAICQTDNNGKYTFTNVDNGTYFITAITPSDGTGLTVIIVREGNTSGDVNFHVWKDDKVKNHEKAMATFMTGCTNAEIAKTKREWIAAEKRWYDSLSAKEKKQCSEEYIRNLMQLIEWITELECEAPDGATLQNGGDVLSGDELESDDAFTLTLEITDGRETEIGADGIQTDEQFVQQSINDAAGDKTIAKYYNISLSKTDGKGTHNIKSIARDTDTTGKVRITMDIPEEYRGHRHYHFVHVHNGVPVTLVDLDDNPDTITFEVDRFSTFALTYTDEVLSVNGEVEEEEEQPEEVTNFGARNACIRAMLNENTRCQVTLLSGIDGLNYRAVGFEVTVGETTRMLETKTVYTSVSALSAEGSRISVEPDQFGGNSKYIFGSAIAFGEKFANETLTYRPYAIDFSGNYIYGKTSTINPIFKEVTE